MNSLVKDVSKLSSVNEKYLNKLVELSIYSICSEVEESIINESNISEIDIGIGQLYIQHIDNELKFKFMPNAKLRDEIIETMKNKENPMQVILEDNLVDKIERLYKDIL